MTAIAVEVQPIEATAELLNGHIYEGHDLYEGCAYFATVVSKTDQGVHVTLVSHRRREEIAAAFIPVVELKGATRDEQAATLANLQEDDQIVVTFAGWGEPEQDNMRSPLVSQRLYELAMLKRHRTRN